MKTIGKTTPRKTPVFDAEGYQTNLTTLNGLALPKLREVSARPLRRGGARPGAGRKPTGRQAILLRLAPTTVRALRATARREGKTLSEIANQQLAQI